MDDFRDEKELLEKTGAGITIRSGEELLDGILTLVSDPDTLVKRGEEGRKMVVANMGAAERYGEMICRSIRKKS
jgi:3-deoxy-D-manno-octulosonic-acid transferase